MIRYKVSYFKSGGVLEQEYPLSLPVATLRQDYLKRFIKGYVWLEQIKKEVKKCVRCNRFLTKEEVKYYNDTCENCEIEMDKILYSEVDEIPKNWNGKMWRKK